MDAGNADMTLAFELTALKALAHPHAAVTDAREWTAYIGVVSEEPTYVVTNYTRQERIRQDFFSGPRGVEESLESVKDQFNTERYVFVGTNEEDASLAESVGWEYLAVADAADAAGWELAEGEDEEEWIDEDVREDWP